MIHLPKGFTPVTLEKMLWHFREHPAMGGMLFKHIGLPEKETASRITDLEAKKLVQFAIGPANDPSVFIAPPTAFASGEERDLADKLVSFWDAQGKFDAASGHLERPDSWVVRVITPDGEIAIVESVAKKLLMLKLLTIKDGVLHGPSKAQVIAWTEQHGVCDFCSDPNPLYVEDVAGFEFMPGYTSEGGWATCEACHQLVITNNRSALLKRGIQSSHLGGKIGAAAQAELHRKFWEVVDAKTRPIPVLPPSKQPHWQEALDQKMNAIYKLKTIERLVKDYPTEMSEIQKLDILEDLSALTVAEVYSFNADTMHAIMTGMQSIPHESSLLSIELPTARAGWFWFAQPYPISASPIASDMTAALLWSWEPSATTPTLRFSAYVIDHKTQAYLGEIIPSTKWVWPINLTFHEMIAFNTQLYRNAYGPGGHYSDQEKQFMIGEKGTMKVVAELSLFFMMSCLWFRQTVPGTKKKIDPKLTQEQPHVERHLRRRHERDFNVKPVVRVIALRRSTAVPVEPTEAGEKKHHLTVRFVVSGHARLQPCGPGRVDRKLIWIDPYHKGPDDAPFKESGPKVFAVVR